MCRRIPISGIIFRFRLILDGFKEFLLIGLFDVVEEEFHGLDWVQFDQEFGQNSDLVKHFWGNLRPIRELTEE
jgi:hypothetical protein